MGLRLFVPGDVVGEAGAAVSLSVVFREQFAPVVLANVSQKTRAVYADAVRWWVRLTGDPPLSQVDDARAARFLADLRSAPAGRCGRSSLSDWTVRKHTVSLGRIFEFCGPRGSSRAARRNLGLLDFPPLFDRVRVWPSPVVRYFTVEELRALLGACGSMTSPRVEGITAADWWRAAVLLAYYSGLRVGALLALEWRDLVEVGGRWYVVARGECAKGGKGSAKYVPPSVVEALERLRLPGRRFLLRPGECSSYFWLVRLLRRLEAAAGIPEGRRWGWHGFRRSHASLIAAGGGGVAAAQVALGHSSPSTTAAWYVGGDVRAALEAAAVDGLPSLS